MTEKKTITDERARQFYVHATAWDMCDNPKSSGSATARASLSREWDSWLAAHDARVHREGAREALDGLVRDLAAAGEDAEAEEVRAYRDTHYPETEN